MLIIKHFNIQAELSKPESLESQSVFVSLICIAIVVEYIHSHCIPIDCYTYACLHV